jgi:hypothetical protein
LPKATYKTKYLTFGIKTDEIDILNNFKRFGVMAASLNGTERLR